MSTAADLVADLADLYDDGRTTACLLDRVRELLEPGATRSRDDHGHGGGRRRPAAPLPVAGAPFALLTDVHAGAREHEGTLHRLAGFGPVDSGTRDAGTGAALRALPALLDLVPVDTPAAREVLGDLRSWHRRALLLTGHVQPWARLTGYSCPGCAAQSLRQHPTTGALVCCTPSCRDPEGRRYAWGLDELDRLGLVVTS